MTKGGCATCMTGGSGSSMAVLVLAIGVMLVIMGFVIYANDLLDVSIQPVDKAKVNTYVGYGSIVVGSILVLIALFTKA